MRLQTTTPLHAGIILCSPRPSCPRCGEDLLAPEMAEFVREGRIRHTWLCDACEYEFRTCVAVLPD